MFSWIEGVGTYFLFFAGNVCIAFILSSKFVVLVRWIHSTCVILHTYSMLCKKKKEWVYMAAYSMLVVTCHACRWVRPSRRRQIALVVLSFWRPGPGDVTPYGKAARGQCCGASPKPPGLSTDERERESAPPLQEIHPMALAWIRTTAGGLEK
jgi:hypothetical protein